MRVAVISDTHGNLPALEAVLAALDADGPWDQTLMGGDIAFAGPFPAECIRLVRERAIPAVRGNTDEALVVAARGPVAAWQGEEGAVPHDAQLRRLDDWALARLGQADVEYLAGLPLRVDIEGPAGRLALVHATPWSPWPPFRPGISERDVSRLLGAVEAQTLAYGHIHLQHTWRSGDRQLVAVGSVGSPFDGDPSADYATFESCDEGWRLALRQVPYDVERTVAAAVERGLPDAELFIRRWRTGRAD